MAMTTKEFATYVARVAEVCEQLRELRATMTYKQLAEDIRLIPRGIPWKTHCFVTMANLSLLLDVTAATERKLGRDGADFTSRIVEARTGKPAKGFYERRAHLTVDRKATA